MGYQILQSFHSFRMTKMGRRNSGVDGSYLNKITTKSTGFYSYLRGFIVIVIPAKAGIHSSASDCF